MAKEKETENRSERERFLDCMLKEILSGQRNPGDRLPTESELASSTACARRTCILACRSWSAWAF